MLSAAKGITLTTSDGLMYNSFFLPTLSIPALLNTFTKLATTSTPTHETLTSNSQERPTQLFHQFSLPDLDSLLPQHIDPRNEPESPLADQIVPDQS